MRNVIIKLWKDNVDKPGRICSYGRFAIAPHLPAATITSVNLLVTNFIDSRSCAETTGRSGCPL